MQRLQLRIRTGGGNRARRPRAMAACGRAALCALGIALVQRARAAHAPAARHRPSAAAPHGGQLAAGVRWQRAGGADLPHLPAARASGGQGPPAARAAAGAHAPSAADRAVPGPERAQRWAGAAVAVPAGGTGGQGARHRVGGQPRGGRVPAVGAGRGGAALGRAQAQAQHELRQAVARAPVLLRQEHHEQGAGHAVRIPLQLGGARGRQPARRAALLALPAAKSLDLRTRAASAATAPWRGHAARPTPPAHTLTPNNNSTESPASGYGTDYGGIHIESVWRGMAFKFYNYVQVLQI